MPVKTIRQARGLIRDWMSDRMFIDPALSPSSAPEGFHFVIGGKAANGLPFSILQPAQLKRTVVVIANVSLAKEHFDAFNSMEIKDRENLLLNLQRDLIFQSPTYSFNQEYERDGIFKGLQFIKEISYDELTEGKLGDAVNDVTKCVLWVIWTFREAFGPLKE